MGSYSILVAKKPIAAEMCRFRMPPVTCCLGRCELEGTCPSRCSLLHISIQASEHTFLPDLARCLRLITGMIASVEAYNAVQIAGTDASCATGSRSRIS
jgi:hypothetical protein